jgi:hypothetical protein
VEEEAQGKRHKAGGTRQEAKGKRHKAGVNFKLKLQI